MVELEVRFQYIEQFTSKSFHVDSFDAGMGGAKSVLHSVHERVHRQRTSSLHVQLLVLWSSPETAPTGDFFTGSKPKTVLCSVRVEFSDPKLFQVPFRAASARQRGLVDHAMPASFQVSRLLLCCRPVEERQNDTSLGTQMSRV